MRTNALPQSEQRCHEGLSPFELKNELVALAKHRSERSTPQQVQMTLFALAGLLDRDGAHKALARAIVGARFERLYAAAWASLNPTTRSTRAITRRSRSARLKPTGGRL